MLTVVPMDNVYFFGCNEQSGHHLYPRVDFNTQLYHVSRAIDGCPMLLPPESIGAGALTYLPAIDMTDLAWWGSPWDSRPGVNNHVLVRGQHDADAVWKAFEVAFPRLAQKLQRPSVVTLGGGADTKEPAAKPCTCKAEGKR